MFSSGLIKIDVHSLNETPEPFGVRLLCGKWLDHIEEQSFGQECITMFIGI